MSMPSSGDSPARVGTYLQLLRPANVVTALADVLAGTAAVGAPWSPALLWLLPGTASLYAGGVVLNDFFDRDLDAIERPERPIPSGRISSTAAARLGAGLLGAGLLCAAAAGPVPLVVGGVTAALVVLYDAVGKRHGLLGPVNMGACRAANLAFGMAAAPAALPARSWLLVLPLAYIAGVTVISRGEVGGGKRPVAAAALGLVAGVSGAMLGVAATGRNWASLWAFLLALAMAARVVPAFWQAWRNPTPGPIRAAVRTGVLSLVLLDAVIAARYADIMVSLAVLATGVLAGWLARRFAVT